MLVKILVIVGIIVLFYVGIKLVLRGLPDFFSRERLNTLKKAGDFSIAVDREMSFSALGKTLGKKMLVQGALWSVPVIVVHEQRKVLGDKIEGLEEVVKRLKRKMDVKYFTSPLACLDGRMVSLRKQIAVGDFDYSSLLAEVDGLKDSCKSFLPYFKDIEKMFQEAYSLLEKIKEQTDDAEVLSALDELEAALEDYRNIKINFDDVEAMVSLKEELGKVLSFLKQCSSVEISNGSTVNYYEALGVNSDADDKEIKRAYQKKSIQYHPDRKEAELGKIDDEDIRKEVEKAFNERIILIKEAYEILSDPVRRKEYDEQLGLT